MEKESILQINFPRAIIILMIIQLDRIIVIIINNVKIYRNTDIYYYVRSVVKIK